MRDMQVLAASALPCSVHSFDFLFAEMQRSSGLRVLQRLMERQQSIEAHAHHQPKAGPRHDQPQGLHLERKKPPAKLRPFHHT